MQEPAGKTPHGDFLSCCRAIAAEAEADCNFPSKLRLFIWFHTIKMHWEFLGFCLCTQGRRAMIQMRPRFLESCTTRKWWILLLEKWSTSSGETELGRTALLGPARKEVNSVSFVALNLRKKGSDMPWATGIVGCWWLYVSIMFRIPYIVPRWFKCKLTKLTVAFIS